MLGARPTTHPKVLDAFRQKCSRLSVHAVSVRIDPQALFVSFSEFSPTGS